MRSRWSRAWIALTIVLSALLGLVAFVWARGTFDALSSWVASISTFIASVAAIMTLGAQQRSSKRSHEGVAAGGPANVISVGTGAQATGNEQSIIFNGIAPPAAGTGTAATATATPGTTPPPAPSTPADVGASGTPVSAAQASADAAGPSADRTGADSPGRHRRGPDVERHFSISLVDGLIGRNVHVSRIVKHVRSGQPGLFAVLGGHGMGKSTFLGLLRGAISHELPEVLLLPTTANVNAESYGLSESYAGEYGERLTADVARQVFDRSSQFLGEIVHDLSLSFEGFNEAVDAARSEAARPVFQNVIQASGWARVSNARMDLVVDGAAIVAQLAAAQATLDTAFVNDWQAWLGDRRAVLIVDGFETLVDDAVGDWFASLASRLPNTVVVVPVIPQEYGAAATGLLHPERSQLLTLFTTTEVFHYLANRYGDEVTEPLATVVHEFTGGHPFGLRLVAELIDERQEEGLDAEALRRLLTQLSRGGAVDIAELVGLVVRRERRPELWRAVEVASLPNSFDSTMLTTLLETEPGGSDVVLRINRLGLLEALPDNCFRLHDSIRPALAARFHETDRAGWTDMHRAAAAFYYDRISSFEDRTDKPYGSWLKYEDPVWQGYQTEWLHHSAQLPTDRHIVRTQFVVLFMEAFWWWGMYVDFSFCHQLLASWHRSSNDDIDLSLHEQMDRFHRNYLPGPVKEPGPNWAEVRHAIRAIRDLCGLEIAWSDVSEQVRAARHLATLYLRLFTAHSWWYERRYDLAVREYAALEPEFIDLEDGMMLEWLYFEWCDIAIAAGDREGAVSRLLLAAEQTKEIADTGEADSELLANLHRCLGDLMITTDPPAAAREYGLAVLNAYLLQRTTNSLELTINPPDEYTQRFYQEITERATEAVAGRPELLPALLAPVDGTVAADGVTPVFPRGPLDSEVYRRTSEFNDLWGDLVDRLQHNVLADIESIMDTARRLSDE